MTADVAGDLSAAGGVADQRDVSQVERLDHGCEIVGVAVHVVSR
jgi:phosphoribosylformimino-5-aminoimidazole carboxamide ribonucleotide (ProFAR) isomerase